jgi:hypothetical protein
MSQEYLDKGLKEAVKQSKSESLDSNKVFILQPYIDSYPSN